MEKIFLELLNMSIAASWLILAVIIIRALLGKAPKGFRYVLWALVAIRLISPFSIESALSLVPDMDLAAPEDITQVEMESPDKNQSVPYPGPVGTQDKVQNDVQNNVQDNVQGIVSGGNGDVQAGSTIISPAHNGKGQFIPRAWLAIGSIMLIYMVVSYLYLWNKVKASISIGENVFICDEIRSPFILGIVRPHIYLPSHIEKEQMTYIVAHEKEHLRCFDYLWKPLGFVILAIHWFNPLVWVAYVLMCRDLEMACDERVIRNMSATDKRNYSETLLACSTPRHYISACPVAFGEIGIKERIKRVLSYKKPTVWIIGIAVIACIVISICFMTNPKTDILGEPEETESESETESETEFESETEKESKTVSLPMGLNFYGDVDHDNVDETLFIVAQMEDGTTPRADIVVDVDAEVNSDRIGEGGRYILITYEGKEYLMSYCSRLWEDSVESYYRISSWENGKRVQLDYERIFAYFSEADQIDTAEWLEYARKLNEYLANSYLLAGFDGKEFIFSSADDPLTYTEDFHWLMDGEVDKESSIETVLNTFITQAKEKYSQPPEKVVYQTVADLTHDGVEDLVQFLMYSPDYGFDLNGEANAFVKVFRGTEEGTYESEAAYVSDYYHHSRVGNGTIVLTKKDGQDYLMFSNMNEHQGEAYYQYQVYYIGEDNSAVVVDTDDVSFANAPDWPQWDTMPHREDVVPTFMEKMAPWIENGILLFALDIREQIYMSTEEVECPASTYFDQVWARKDEE